QPARGGQPEARTETPGERGARGVCRGRAGRAATGGSGMSATAAERSLDELTMDSKLALEDLVDRAALREMVGSFYELFRIPLRIYSDEGVLLSDVSEQPAVYGYLNEFRSTRDALMELVHRVKAVDPRRSQEPLVACITGATYQVFAIQYDSRQIGRLILGPFRQPEQREIPRELL